MAERQQYATLTGIDLPPAAETSGDILVMLHGYGSNEKDLLQLAPALDGRLRCVSLRAPLRLEEQMFGWFPIAFTPDGISYDRDQAAQARQDLADALKAIIERHQPRDGRVWLMGFSQGAVMSYLTALHTPEVLQGVLALSGRYPDAPGMNLRLPEAVATLPFLVIHGLYDDVLPVDNARRARERLEGRVGDLVYREYPMGHGISDDALDEIGRWLTLQLDRQENRAGTRNSRNSA